MRTISIPRPRLLLAGIALAAAAIAAAILLTSSSSAASRRVVKEADNATLGKTILTDNRGRTLYHLSAERKRFVCEGRTCLELWKPLTVPDDVRPKGPVALRTRERPDGRTQVTYKGLPLYRFVEDKPGEANGEGFRDVGVWHAATVPGTAPAEPEATTPPTTSPEPEPAPQPEPYPGGYGY